MKRINKLDDARIEKMKVDFERVMTWTYRIWDRHNFRIPTDQTRGTINTAILESVGNYIASKTDEFIDKNQKTIFDNYGELIEDETYFEAVTKSTGNKAKVLDRFRLAHEILDKFTDD
jgi:hypothetical protein